MEIKTPYGDLIWVNISSGNGLLPVNSKPLPEPMLTYHQLGPVAITWGQFQEKYLSSITKVSLKITYLKIWFISQGSVS